MEGVKDVKTKFCDICKKTFKRGNDTKCYNCKDKEKRVKNNLIHDTQKSNGDMFLMCANCSKMSPRCDYEKKTKHGEDTRFCLTCFKKLNTDKLEHRREYDRSEARKKRKIEFKKLHPEKLIEYDARCKLKKAVANPEQVLSNNAMCASKHQKKYPEKGKEYKKSHRGRELTYKNAAKQKGIPYMLPTEKFRELISNSCFYCLRFSEDSTNGIDRLDSCKGYTIDNVRSCCKECNMAKNDMSPKEFISQVARIITYQDKRLDLFELFSNYPYNSRKGSEYKHYMVSAKKRGIYFELDKDTFDEIVSKPCYICDERPADGFCGIDRVINDIGYIPLNCKPCCNTCNLMKKDSKLDQFFEMCRKIVDNFKRNTIILPDAIMPTRIRLEKSVFKKKPDLTAREKSLIITSCRNDMGDYPIIYSRVKLNMASEEEVQRYERYKTNVQESIYRALMNKLYFESEKTGDHIEYDFENADFGDMIQ